jgi:isopentenyl diphosphate isomerase/L-lactate dehydrogenase-like FMN-dependent dehydrogenase
VTDFALHTTDIGIDQARAAMADFAFDYCNGGAGDESGLRRNIERLDAITFVPRVLRDVSRPDTAVEVLGSRLSAPLLVAPMGLQALCHPEAEVATAAATWSLGLGTCLSTFSSRSVEEVTAGGAGPLWQQIYLLRDRSVSWSLVERAEAAGATALICTADVPVAAARRRDIRNGFRRFEAAPPALIHDPRFTELLAARQRQDPAFPPATLVDELFPDPAVTWDDLAELRSRTRLPVILKGVLHPRDAARAVDAGVDAVLVSTHGGRQGDRHIAAIDALPGVLAAVADRVPVLLDSGVRRGSHIVAALALGATAVLVGRPVLWGLATLGQAGVRTVLETLIDEMTRTMRLLGASRISDLDQNIIEGEVGA